MTTRRRLAAVAAIVLVAIVAAVSVVSLSDDLRRFVLQVPLLVAATFAGWYALTRSGARRWVGAGSCVAAILGIVIVEIVDDGDGLQSVCARLAMLLVAVTLARFAIGRDARSLMASDTPGLAVPAAKHGTLIINPKSGGGKAERARLADQCSACGIRPIVLSAGDDLVQLANDAIDGGADVIGMAGGDGSFGLVASVAAARHVPMVVVPAGTRNHFALDLGLDRDDLLGALDAFDEAVERRVDLADVNGRAFLNNVSLGLYAAIVRSPEYRDAKMQTVLATLPSVLGPSSEPFDLQFAGSDGRRHDSAHVIQVSNNPYGKASGSRPRLDTHQLGVIAVEIDGDGEASLFLAAAATGHPERFDGFTSWTTETFEVTSASPIDIGLDGESLVMEPPLSFSIRGDALRVRLPQRAIGYSPTARSMPWRSAVRAVWAVALGRGR